VQRRRWRGGGLRSFDILVSLGASYQSVCIYHTICLARKSEYIDLHVVVCVCFYACCLRVRETRSGAHYTRLFKYVIIFFVLFFFFFLMLEVYWYWFYACVPCGMLCNSYYQQQSPYPYPYIVTAHRRVIYIER
jgi:hypothetical protein